MYVLCLYDYILAQSVNDDDQGSIIPGVYNLRSLGKEWNFVDKYSISF